MDKKIVWKCVVALINRFSPEITLQKKYYVSFVTFDFIVLIFEQLEYGRSRYFQCVTFRVTLNMREEMPSLTMHSFINLLPVFNLGCVFASLTLNILF